MDEKDGDWPGKIWGEFRLFFKCGMNEERLLKGQFIMVENPRLLIVGRNNRASNGEGEGAR